MDFKNFKRQDHFVLEDDFVQLRLIKQEDVKLLYPLLADEAVFKYHLTPTNNEQDLEKYFETTIENNLANRDYPFLVYDKKLKEYAGTTRYYEINPANKSLLIGYTWYGSKFQGTGLNKHCKFLLYSLHSRTLVWNGLNSGQTEEMKEVCMQ